MITSNAVISRLLREARFSRLLRSIMEKVSKSGGTRRKRIGPGSVFRRLRFLLKAPFGYSSLSTEELMTRGEHRPTRRSLLAAGFFNIWKSWI